MIEAAPLQVYTGALLFSPSKSVVRELFQQNIPDWISLKPKVPDEWGALLQTLEGHFISVNSVAMSLENTQEIISVSDRWVLIDQVRAIFLPENCRAGSCTSSGGKLGIGSRSGVVTVLRFDLTKFN